MKLATAIVSLLLSPLAWAQNTPAECKAMKCIPSLYGREYTGCTCPQNNGDPALRGMLIVPPHCDKTTDADGAVELQCDLPGYGKGDDSPPAVALPEDKPQDHVVESSTDRQKI